MNPTPLYIYTIQYEENHPNVVVKIFFSNSIHFGGRKLEFFFTFYESFSE
jgi:hypothetical protein